MLHFTLKKRFDTKWTVKDNFGVLLKFSNLIEMSRVTLKSHYKGLERNLLSTVTEHILNLPAVHLGSEQSSLWARFIKLQELNHDVKGCRQNFCNTVKVVFVSFCELKFFQIKKNNLVLAPQKKTRCFVIVLLTIYLVKMLRESTENKE